MSTIAQDLQNLPQIFAASVAGNQTTRLQAEEALKRLESSKETFPQFLKALYQLSLSSSQQPNAHQLTVSGVSLELISLSAAIYLKNIVSLNWLLPVRSPFSAFFSKKSVIS